MSDYYIVYTDFHSNHNYRIQFIDYSVDNDLFCR